MEISLQLTEYFRDLFCHRNENSEENWERTVGTLMHLSKVVLDSSICKARESYCVWQDASLDIDVLMCEKYSIWESDSLYLDLLL